METSLPNFYRCGCELWENRNHISVWLSANFVLPFVVCFRACTVLYINCRVQYGYVLQPSFLLSFYGTEEATSGTVRQFSPVCIEPITILKKVKKAEEICRIGARNS